MQVFPPDCLGPVMTWLSDLPYPWCQPSVAVKGMPKLQGIAEIADYINRKRATA